MWLHRLISGVQDWILRRPKQVVAASAALLVVALVLASTVEFRTSRNELAPPDDPDQKRWTELLEEYTGTQALIAAVEVAPGQTLDPERLYRFTDRVAAELGQDERVGHVFHRVDVDWFLDRGLYLVPAATLQEAVAGIDADPELLDALPRIRGTRDLVDVMARRIERGLVESTGLPETESTVAADGLVRFVEALHDFLARPAEAVEALSTTPPLLVLAGDRAAGLTDGYLKTHDGRMTFVILSPRDSDDSLPFYRSLVADMRAKARSLLVDEPGFSIGFTGQPALVVDEMDTVRLDTWITSAIAVIGVTLLTFLVFRWRSHALLVLGALGVGVLWSFGAVRLSLGYLNLITSSFISTLVGVGVAYGIHPVSEYELEGAHTGDLLSTVRSAYDRTGAAVTVAAVTTAVAFFSILLMRFRGFAELGLVAGVGVLLCLLAAMVLLPALLVVYGRRRQRRSPGDGPRRGAAVDRLWLERAAGHVCRFPALTCLVGLAITILLGAGLPRLELSTNILDLLPRNAESLKLQRRLALESELSPLFNIVAADDLEELAQMRDRAAAETSIDRFDSVLRFVPDDVAATRQALDELRERITGLELATSSSPVERTDLASSLERLEFAITDGADAAFGAGLGDLAAALEEARASVENSAALIRSIDEDHLQDLGAAEDEVLLWARGMLDWVHRAIDVEPPTLDTLPREMRERFLTRSGKPLGFLYPAESVFDTRARAEYAAASRRVAADATGFPIVFHSMSNRIVTGFNLAVAVGAALVLLLLLLQFRALGHALLAMVPLMLGTLWMGGLMGWLGIQFNLANLVAVPLIIGVGIDNGVHIIQRIRLEGREGISVVLRHTGRAILIASLTTMIGFGSLAFASHRGMYSLGLVLLLGVGSCLLTSTIVLPNLLVLLGIVRR